MADPRFYRNAGPFTLEHIARHAGIFLADGVDPAREISDVAPLSTASASDISFLDNPRYRTELQTSTAAACILAPDKQEFSPDGMVLLVTSHPYRAWARTTTLFYPDILFGASPSDGRAIHPDARVDSNARIETGVVIGAGAEIGGGTLIAAGSVIGDGVAIGRNCRIGPNATILYSLVGDRVIIHSGASIGQDGFGFAMGKKHLKVPQLGRVIIQDDVEIGANTTIDRGAIPDTVIGEGCKIDNLVQIGHNVRMGRGCVIAGQTGISGSVEIGDMVLMGGQIGIVGHLKIGAGARIAARSGIIRDVAPGVTMAGIPALAIGQWKRQTVALRRLADKNGKQERMEKP